LGRVERVYAPVSFVVSGVGWDPHRSLIRIKTREVLLASSRSLAPFGAPESPRYLAVSKG